MKTKLTPELEENICKKLKTGTYAKIAAESEGITERVFYKWLTRGEEALKLAEKEIEYPESEKIYVQFVQSVRQAIAEGEVILVTAVYGKITEDWKAAIEVLARRFPARWAKRDYMHVDQEITEKPSRLKEFEDEYLKDVPESKMKDIAKGFQKLIEEAKNGKPPTKDKG